MCLCSFFRKDRATSKRETKYERKSKETEIVISRLNIDGKGESSISTGIGFLDHMLTLFAYHGYFDITLKAKGDTHVDNHHLNEDIGISLGEAFKKALGEERGIVRMASAEVPMDMAGARVVIDLSNRPAFKFSFGQGVSEKIITDSEGYSLHYAKDFLESFSKKLCANIHIEIAGDGDMHHYLEAVFKALGVALDSATKIDSRRRGEVPSSKGIL
ncbi:imidazoleglycerol-phosphate dehydratase [Candidatus Omnitrophus magneticus]|uniref:Imidazoleglycerol-phosphate dehydratase n=1 Tax=Candidatus Omnitrophus magneticus TaxID=1609969 RepID=A0A0F0CN65_9BACT|nr:imidazoleglycerol-phosphate dehydratase [Candidatus Omnitrophus magneticus]